jgi:hypothetical protein
MPRGPRGDFLTIDRRKLQQVAGRGAGTKVREITTRAAAIASTTAPGSMKEKVRPIMSGTKNAPFGIIMVDHPAAGYVINGTRPHPIVAKGGALKFEWKGRTVYFKSVNHPGTKPNNFVWRAVLAASKL